MIHKRLTLLAMVLTLPLSSFSISSSAGEKEDELIAKITAAYGGEALINLDNYQIEERFLSITYGQGHSPELSEVAASAQNLIVDLKNNRAVYDTWFEGRGGGNQNATVSDGEKAHTINYQAQTFGEAANADPHVFAGGTMRTSDTILVYELNKVKDKATLSDDARFMSRPHHVLSMPFPSSPDLLLYVDAQTHLISKMVRVNPQLGNLDYVYADYKTRDGITYASRIDFSVAGQPNLISTRHELRFNQSLSDQSFKVPDGFKPEGQRIDTSQMLVNKLSDQVYHVGQGNGYSLFIDTNLGIIAAGGYPALPARFKRFQKESNNFKPLVYQVVTHHHSDHLGGMDEAIELGAKLITVKDNVEAIKQATSTPIDDHNFSKVGPKATYGDGKNRVEVYEVSTIHAESFLVTYAPATKTIFIADHFGSPFADSVPVANQSTVDMLTALDALKLDIRTITTAHSARVFSMSDLRKSVAAYTPASCSGGRPVCL